MMRWILLFTLALASQWSSSQSLYVGLGYNRSFTNPEGINYVVDRYNETRNYLSMTMKPLTWSHGFTLDASLGAGDHFAMNVSYTGRKRTLFAEGIDNTQTLQRREVEVKYNSLGFGGIYQIYPARKTTIGFGAELQLHFMNIQTRVGKKSIISSRSWEEVSFDLGTSVALLARLHWKVLTIQPYYCFDIAPSDAADLNSEINKNTAGNDPETISNNMSHFGIKLMLGLATHND